MSTRRRDVQYALLIYGDQSAWAELDDDEAARLRAESMPRWLALFEEMAKADPAVAGRELVAASEAKVVRVIDGERVVTDGPFAETKELIDGFALVKADSKEAAVALATEFMQLAGDGTGEILQVFDQGEQAVPRA